MHSYNGYFPLYPNIGYPSQSISDDPNSFSYPPHSKSPIEICYIPSMNSCGTHPESSGGPLLHTLEKWSKIGVFRPHIVQLTSPWPKFNKFVISIKFPVFWSLSRCLNVKIECPSLNWIFPWFSPRGSSMWIFRPIKSRLAPWGLGMGLSPYEIRFQRDLEG